MTDRGPRILLSMPTALAAQYLTPLALACRDLGLDPDIVAAGPLEGDFDYVVFSPDGPVSDFSRFPGLKAALGIWAGVERIVGNPTLTVPLCRMVDPGLSMGMLDYVTAHVLRHHVNLDAVLARQDGVWDQGLLPPVAADRTVGFLGLGSLGGACARRMSGLGFRTMGWSRRQAAMDGVDCRTGREGLEAVLRGSDIVVALLPDTPQTANLLDAATLAWMRPGAVLINAGRGSLIDDADLLAALDGGRVGHATLDAFRTEPLPADHPYWGHPRVTVTPHIAAATRVNSACAVLAQNILRGETGGTLLNQVDRAAGY